MNIIGIRLIATVCLVGWLYMPVAAKASDLPEGPPLFVAFKAFCVDTGLKPGAVRTAVMAADGEESHKSAHFSLPPGRRVNSFWLAVTLGGHKIDVEATSVEIAASGGRPHSAVETCTLTSHANEDASIPLIVSWVGVAPIATDGGSSYFSYEEKNNRRRAITDGDAAAAAAAKGTHWVLVINQLRDRVTVSIDHSRIIPDQQP